MNSQTDISYLFIDGGYIKRVIEKLTQKLGFQEPVPFNWVFPGFKKIFYYDSPPPRKTNQTDDEYSEAVESHKQFVIRLSGIDRFHVIQGDITGSDAKPRQKGVDVKLAVDMLTHAMRQNMTVATLLSGDLDFKPVIEALVAHGLTTVVWSEKSSSSEKLLLSADERKPFDVSVLMQMTPVPFNKDWRFYGYGSSTWGPDDLQEEKYQRVYSSDDSEQPEIVIGFDGEHYRANLLIIEGITGDKKYQHYIHDNYSYMRRYISAMHSIDLPEYENIQNSSNN